MASERGDRARRGRLDWGTMAAALAFIGLGTFMVWSAQTMTPLGAVFPTTIGTAMIVIAAVLMVATALRPQAPKGDATISVRSIGLVVIMAAWVALLSVVGFFAASGLAFAGLVLVANYRRWTMRRLMVHAGSGCLILAGFYALFVELLNVPAPRGSLF